MCFNSLCSDSQNPVWTNARPAVALVGARGGAERLALRAVSLSSAAVGRAPVLGLEGEPGLRRAQPHPAGEQKAGEGLGEPVAQ